MGMFDKLESRLEQGVNGAFARAFKAEVQPVELAAGIRRAMDDRAASLGKGKRPIVPNLFTIELSPTDYTRLSGWGNELDDELIASAQEHADEQRYLPGGPLTIVLHETDDLETGVFRLRPSTANAEHARAAIQADPRSHRDERHTSAGHATGHDADHAVSPSAVSARPSSRDEQNASGSRADDAAPDHGSASQSSGQQPSLGSRIKTYLFGGYAPEPQGSTGQDADRAARAHESDRGRVEHADGAHRFEPQAFEDGDYDDDAWADHEGYEDGDYDERYDDRDDRDDRDDQVFEDDDSADSAAAHHSPQREERRAPRSEPVSPRPAGGAAALPRPHAPATAPAWDDDHDLDDPADHGSARHDDRPDSTARFEPPAPARPRRMSPRERPWLEIDGQRYPLLGAITVLGRDDDVDIVVDDPGVSRHHSEIRITHDGPHLVMTARDLGSTNGTFVNGERITTEHIHEGDRLTLGRTPMIIHLGDRP